MAITPTSIATVAPYIGAGKRRIIFVPTIAVMSAPTNTEINAGTDLSAAIKPDGISGWSTTSEQVDAGNYGTRKAGKVPGMITFADSTIDFNADISGTNPVATLLPRDTAGYILDCFAGLTGKMNVFKVVVSVSSLMPGSASDLVTWHTEWSIQDSAENVTIP